jgi:hypothetical protein
LHKTTDIEEVQAFLFPQHILADAHACLTHTFLSRHATSLWMNSMTEFCNPYLVITLSVESSYTA